MYFRIAIFLAPLLTACDLGSAAPDGGGAADLSLVGTLPGPGADLAGADLAGTTDAASGDQTQPTCTIPKDTAAHGAATTPDFMLKTLDGSVYPHAVCNDGTPATYAIRRNTASTRWLVFLEGGGFCMDNTTCAQRYNAAPGGGGHNMSSTLDRQTAANNGGKLPAKLGGIFAATATENPTFYDANIVRLLYCSSDLWSGEKAGDDTLPITNVARWHFRGRAIVQAAFAELSAHEGLGAATDVVLAGASAGGAGVFNNVDDVAAWIPAGARYLGLPDAGFFIDYPTYDPVTMMEGTGPSTYEQIMVAANMLWGGRGDASCDAAATTDAAHLACRSPEVMGTSGWIATPLLILQSEYDSRQLYQAGITIDDNTGVVPSAPQAAFAHRFAARMRDRLGATDARHALFGNYSWYHIVDTYPAADPGDRSSTEQTVNGVSMRDAIEAWHVDPCSPARAIEAEDPSVP
jgi:hypothetical protein